MKDERGFTLIELIITGVMLGMLASLVTLGVNYFLTSGKDRIVKSDLATLKAAARLFLLDRGGIVPVTINPGTPDAPGDLVPNYLPELPGDPYSRITPAAAYLIEIRTDGTGARTIYIASRGVDGTPNTADDQKIYVK